MSTIIRIVIIKIGIGTVMRTGAPPSSVVIALNTHVVSITLQASLRTLNFAVIILVESIPIVTLGANSGNPSCRVGHVGSNTVRELSLVNRKSAGAIDVSCETIDTVIAFEGVSVCELVMGLKSIILHFKLQF